MRYAKRNTRKRQLARTLMKPRTTTLLRWPPVAIVFVLPAVVVLRSYLENKAILDSVLFVTSITLIVGGILFFAKDGLPLRRN
jgi:hypothetical protein